MIGEWNYKLSWYLNDIIVKFNHIPFQPQDVERCIVERTDPRDGSVYYWILELNYGNFIFLTGTRVYSTSVLSQGWMFVFQRERFTFNGVVCEAPMFIQREFETRDGEYVESVSLTVGQIIKDRRDKAERLEHLQGATRVLSAWIKLVQSEGYT